MQVYLITDGEFETTRQAELKELIKGYYIARGCFIIEKTLQRDDLAFVAAVSIAG